MDHARLKHLLQQVQTGEVPVEEAIKQLQHLPFEDLGFAKVDHHRGIRHGMPEVVFGQGKTAEQILAITQALAARASNVLVTRVGPEIATLLLEKFPEGEYVELAKVFRLWRDRTIYGKGTIAIVSAGTSDLPVAEEARVTAEVMGNKICQITDVGVAGIHRLLYNLDAIRSARVCIVCAGMEGALPSVVGGMVSCPVIAVPTSVGYGASFNGLAALLGMLNSCASNVTVVNIDNGFGAAYVATLINRLD